MGSPTGGFAPDFVTSVLDDAIDDMRNHPSGTRGGRVYGITGLQGSGKSTLAAQVARLAQTRGLRAAVLSIDDLYFDHDARQTLGRTIHPLLATRGPPGTHDLDLGRTTLDALRAGDRIALPRFDKISDRRLPPARWSVIERADLILFEGWFLKTPAEPDEALVVPCNALERDEDGHGRWRRFCNAALRDDYPSLWQRIDRLLVLQAPGFDVVPGWRWQQEQTLQAVHPSRTTMTHEQVTRFVQFFERASRQALRSLPAIAEWTVRIDAARHPMPRDTDMA